MDELTEFGILELESAYREPKQEFKSDVTFNIDFYRSHLVPVRETVELKKAIVHE